MQRSSDLINRRRLPQLFLSLAVVAAIVIFAHSSAIAQQESGEARAETLKDDALAISGRYSRFERLLSQMADLMAVEDPDRAELLRRAISQSRERAIATNIDAIGRLLADDSLGDAIDKQEMSANAIRELLKLLQSEDRRSAVEKERERLNNILKDVKNLEAEQRAARATTQNSTAPSNAAPQQQKAANKADKILEGIKEHDKAQAGESESDSAGDREQSDSQDENKEGSKSKDSAKPKSGDKSSEDEKEGDRPKDEASDKEGDKEKSGDKSENAEGNKSSEDSKGDGKESTEQSSPNGEAQQSESQQSQQSQQSQKSDKEEQQEATPGSQQLEQARNMMQEALEALKQQEREEAVDRQDEAIAQLQDAVKKLEELLRQLREEEKEMILASLEARFQRLLALQTQIHESTLDLAATPRKEWLDTAVSQCRDLARQQAELTQDCSQVTGMLREDGTSVSIIVAVEDIETDMGSIATRLQETKVGLLTQSMQTDVLEALKELIEATQNEMEDMKSEERKQQQQQQGEQKKPALVELMAEIRVLRSLQLRVNRRTKQIHELSLEDDQSEADALLGQLEELTRRQDRLRESARELSEQLEQQR